MLPRIPILLSLAFALVAFPTGALAVNCGVCSPTIVYAGLTRKLTLQRYEEYNTVQCNYDTPPIAGKSPGCLYRNIDGVLTFTNTGATLQSLPGACPSPIQVVSEAFCR
ncbi:hypothetical protein DFH06DRAFT_1192192 [Mycena polygramma]|nr:hypothetical protein DFH06DRAFT_1192192 [Mycena polygramma]